MCTNWTHKLCSVRIVVAQCAMHVKSEIFRFSVRFSVKYFVCVYVFFSICNFCCECVLVCFSPFLLLVFSPFRSSFLYVGIASYVSLCLFFPGMNVSMSMSVRVCVIPINICGDVTNSHTYFDYGRCAWKQRERMDCSNTHAYVDAKAKTE